MLQNLKCISKIIAKCIVIFRAVEFFKLSYYLLNLIGNNNVYMIYLNLIYIHFFIINSLWWIKLFPYVIYWIQKLCLIYIIFDEYNYAILKYYLKMSIDQCMMWCFFGSMLRSLLWYGVVWNSIVFCSALFGNMGCYIVVECIKSVLKVYFNAIYCIAL